MRVRAGGGHAKGASWEREVGKTLSLWITDGEHADIFSRNVLSGGSFTIAKKAGKGSARSPGDLMAANPLAFRFLAKYAVECKHLASLGLENFLFDMSGKSMLSQIVMWADGQSSQAGLDYMIIAKQNHRDPFVITAGGLHPFILAATRTTTRMKLHPPYHLLHRRSIFIMRLADFVSHIDPEKLLSN